MRISYAAFLWRAVGVACSRIGSLVGGMLPDATVDRVVHAKYLRGYWINGDPRRFTNADPDGGSVCLRRVAIAGKSEPQRNRCLIYPICPTLWLEMELRLFSTQLDRPTLT